MLKIFYEEWQANDIPAFVDILRVNEHELFSITTYAHFRKTDPSGETF
jgi:hypothetical protein